MKKIAILSVFFASFYAGAQNIRMQTGKKITAVTSITMNMDMGAMGGEMKMLTSSTSEISATGADNMSYKISCTTTKMKMSIGGGPQSMSYDSENKADSSEMGQEMSKGLNKPTLLSVDKITGYVKDASPEKPIATGSSNPLSSMMGADSQSPATLAGAAFFVLPSGKKTGDKWIDSTSDDGIKVVKTYELQTLQNNIAVIGINAVTKMNMDKDAQGMTLTINMNGTSSSSMTTDISSGLVQKMTTKGTMDGTFEVMGQSVPVSMTIDSESAFQ